MADESRMLKGEPTGARGQSLIIVARDRLDLWQALTQQLAAEENIVILLDRRHGERRQSAQPCGPDRRRTDRRSGPNLEEDVRSRQYVIVRPKARRLAAQPSVAWT